MLQLPDDILREEPWLAGYLTPADKDIDSVRRRAARAAKGEVVKRRVNQDDRLLVRRVDGSVTTTEATAGLVLDHHGEPVITTLDGGRV